MKHESITLADPLVRQVREHIERKFSEAALATLPFPHLIIENFFPDDVYAKVLDYNLFRKNHGSDWISARKMKGMRTTTPYDHRKQINFHCEDPFEASAEERAFWKSMTSCFLGDDWFVMLVHDKFPEYFDIRFGEYFTRENLSNFRRELFLQRHDVDYHIGPHTDIATRVFTCIFSFASQPGFEEFGTQILRHKDPLKRCWGDDHYGFEDFELVKTAPYAPNNFLLFFKTRQSFHAVKTVTKDIPNHRYGMQFQFYEKSGGTFEDMSKKDLYVSNHRNASGRIAGKIKDLVRIRG